MIEQYVPVRTDVGSLISGLVNAGTVVVFLSTSNGSSPLSWSIAGNGALIAPMSDADHFDMAEGDKSLAGVVHGLKVDATTLTELRAASDVPQIVVIPLDTVGLATATPSS